jgi:hypothetical protein
MIMHTESDEYKRHVVLMALQFMSELEAFYDAADSPPTIASRHPYTDQLIAESNNKIITDADMDVSDAILILNKFRLQQ